MSGWVMLHPAADAVRGMALSGIDPADDDRSVCLVPGAQSVREYRRIIHRTRLDEESVLFQTFDSFVRGLLPAAPPRLMTPVEQEWLARQAAADALGEDPGHFRAMTGRPGWLKKVEARIGELKRAGVRPARLTSLWENRGGGLPELARVFRTYDRLVKEHRLLDHEEPYFLAMEAIRTGEARLPSRVVAEHFHDLSFLQEQLLIGLVTAGVAVVLHLAWDPERPRLFGETADLCGRLRERGFEIRELQSSRKAGRGRSGPLDHLVREACSPSPRRAEAEGSVQVLAAPGPDKETALVVARLKRWLRESGSPLSEAALITNRPQTYHPILFRELAEAGIPCSRPHARPLTEHPLMQTVLTALSLARGREDLRPVLLESPIPPWTGEKVPAASRTGIWRRLGEPRQAAVLAARLENIPEGPLRDRGLERDRLKGMTELFQWVEGVPVRCPWKAWVGWFEEWVGRLDDPVRRQAMARDPELLPLAAEEWKAWERIRGIVAEWREIFGQTDLGRQPCDREAFIAALEQAAQRKPVELKPGRRGGVRLLEPNQVRGDRYRAVFLLGCAEGEWPRSIREDWLVPDEERERLRGEGLRLALSGEQRAHQLFPFYRCLSAAVEYLHLSYPAVDADGRGRLPSPYVDEVRRVFAGETLPLEQASVSDTLPYPWEACTSLAKGVERTVAVLRGAGEGDGEKGEVRTALSVLGRARRDRRAFMDDLAAKVRVERRRQGSGWSAFDGVLPPDDWPGEAARELEDRVWSASLLNELTRCRFHFFAGRLLGALPGEETEEGLSPLERGDLMHRILCRFWDRYRERPLLPDGRQAAEEHLLATADTIFRQFAEEEGEGRDPFRLRVEKSRIEGKLLAMLEHEWSWREKADAADFRPAYLELAFGTGRDEALLRRREIDPATRERPAELPLPGGRRLRLRGKVDRVDRDDEGRYVLYDYKSGSAPGTAEVKAGAHLQLPLYLWVLQEEFGLDPDKAVGAAFFTPGQRRTGQPPSDNRNQGLWRKEAAKTAGIGDRVAGLLDDAGWDELLAGIRLQTADRLQRAAAGDFAVDPTWECPTHCPHRGVCRIDARHTARKQGTRGGRLDG